MAGVHSIVLKGVLYGKSKQTFEKKNKTAKTNN